MRCERIVGRKDVSIEEVIVRIKKAIEEYHLYKNKKAIIDGKKEGKRINQKWEAPDVGWIKINSDGAFDKDKKEAGSGVIARDDGGKVLGERNKKFSAICAEQAEAVAIKDAVNLAIERKFQKICFETDSKELFLNITNKYSSIDWRIRPLVYDIHKLLKLLPDYKVVLITREANAAADWIARNSRKGMCLSGWDRQLPLSLVRILDKDDLLAPP